MLVASIMFIIGTGTTEAARPVRENALSIVPEITGISLNDDGQLVAAGTVTATIRGRETTVEFEDVPVSIAIAEDQTGAGECPILDLTLGPIELNLLGLLVETSPICLKITAYDGGGLLGDLLCSVSDLLDGGISLDDILGGLGGVNLPPLTTAQVGQLLAGVEDLLNAALGAVLDATIAGIQEQRGRTCAILNLELGPVDLTLLGLNVHLDDCDDGPVTVDITAVRGQLLGNLLCGLLHGDLLNIGDTLGDLIDGLLARLNR
jgi:hypothetical protein